MNNKKCRTLPQKTKMSQNIKRSFPVLGMSCASCASSVEKTVQNSNGVLYASVNFASEKLNVEYNPDIINEEDLQKIVQSSGFDLLIENENDTKIILEKLENENNKTLRNKTIFAIILSLPVVFIGMFYMHMPYANEIMCVFSTPVVLWLGKNFFLNAWKQAQHRTANMDTLVALSTGIAYIFSLFNTIYPNFWSNHGAQNHVYFEAATTIVTFVLLGKLLEDKAKSNTSSSIKKLMGLQPNSVIILQNNGTEKKIPLEEIKKNDIVVVKPGERIAVDGKITFGNSYIDESMLSGEPIPVLKTQGDPVFAGTINQKGSFQFRAEKIGKETILSQIIKTVEEAQGSKAPVQKLVDTIAQFFVPTIILISLITFILWLFLGGNNNFIQGILSAITVLVIACPCALGLATPTAIMVGVGKAAEKGILIKDAESLERSKKINAIILDKTGTITEGSPTLTDIEWDKNDDSKKNILFGIEKKSEHPIAEAITKHFSNIPPTDIYSFESFTGKGVKAKHQDETYLIGNLLFLKENNIAIPKDLQEKYQRWQKQAKTIIWFSNAQKALAVMAISDQIKQNSKQAISILQNMGITVYMLTGDNENTAKSIAKNTGIQHYKAEMLPQQKAEFVKKLQKDGKIVAMVGDGINDSTALATADISIAMGKGSDIAIDVAKVTIISSDLLKIPETIHLSEQTVKTIRQNLFWAFIYNIIGIPIAAGILYPINGFLLNPMFAGGAMALSSVSVVMNSLFLKWKK